MIGGRKKEVLERIRTARDETDVFLKSKTGVPILLEILNSTRVERVHCSEAIFRRIPPGAREALAKMGIGFVIEDAKKGRPRAHSQRIVDDIEAGAGKRAKVIAGEARVPLRTVYYYLRKMRRSKRK